MSETAQAPSLPEERVTRALDPAELVDRDSSLPPARLSQPPSFLDAPAEPARRAPKVPSVPAAGPAARLMIPPPPAISPSLSSLPPPMPPPDRVTMPVIDDEEPEAPKRSSKPTVDGTPRDSLGADLRDSDDSLIGASPRYDEMSGRGAEPPFARRELPKTPAPPPATPTFKPPPRADRAAAFDPLDRPLSPEEFESSISRSSDAGGSALTSSGSEAAYLGPEDVVSGSEQVVLPEAIEAIIPAPGRGGSPLDEPLSPDDFSYSGPAAQRSPSVSVAPDPSGNPLDEPLSPDDFSYDPDRARAAGAVLPQAAPVKPIAPLVGPAPPMAVPRDALRPVPMHSALIPAAQALLDEPLAPSEFSEAASPAPRKPPPKRAEAKAAAPKQAPVRIVAKKGKAPVKVATKPLPKQRPRSDSRLLRYAIPSAVLAVVVVLGVSGGLHWRAGRLRADKIERAEKAEAQGDYGSLRDALVAYREVSDEVPDSREALARVSRTYSLLAFEFGLPDDEREAQAVLGRLAAMGPVDAVSAQIEAEARAYLLAAAGRIDDAELLLRPFQAPDPHLSYLRARIYLHREAYADAERILRVATSVPPSWVRQSCALVEAMLGKDPQGTEWLRLLESLGTSYGSHVGVRLLRARLLADSPHTAENARIELRALAQPPLWNAAAPSEQAWVHLLNAFLSLDRREGRFDPTRELTAARELRPVRDAKFRLMFVRVLLGLRQLGEARAELESIVRDAPPRARSQARLLLAETYIDLGEIDQAEQLLAQSEDSPRMHLLKGRVLMARKQVAAAIREFTAAKDQDPALAVQVDLESSRAHLQINDVTTAISLATELLRLHPNEVRALLLLGDAYLADTSRADRVARAEEKYRQAAAQSPDSFEAQLRLVNLARGRGDLDGANQMIDQILSRDAGNVQAHVARASIAAESGNLEDARSKLTRLQGLPSARSEAGAIAVLEAEIALRAGTTEGVEALLDRAEQAGAEESDLKHVRGLLLLRTYKVQDSLAALRRASQLAPADAIRLGELARAYRLSDTQSSETEQIADSALAIDRRVAEALIVKALIQMDKGLFGPAGGLLREADRALEARPRDNGVRAYVLMARGRLEGELGHAQESQRLLDQALQLDPTLAEAHLNLAMAYPDLGRERDACTEFARFLEMAPGVRDTDLAERERRRLRCR